MTVADGWMGKRRAKLEATAGHDALKGLEMLQAN